MAAPALAVVWLTLCGVGSVIRRAFAGPAQRRLEQAGNAADRAAATWLSGYGRRYRRWVLDSRRYIDVKDLATGGDHTPELDEVYVDVALVRRAPHQIPGSPIAGIPEDATGRRSISEFLNQRESAVLAVVGPPGCGKTTLLGHVARQTAKARNHQRRRLPILLALREQAAAIVADPRKTLPEIARAAASGMPGTEPDGWWDRQFARGKCAVLLDGLDEVAREEDRKTVARWTEQQINNYPGNDFVITSRPHGFPGSMIAQADILAVRPFSAEQVAMFLHRWYFAAERHAAGAVTDAQLRSVRILASQSADRLLALLKSNANLRDLTANPLLLTMIAMVHRYRGALPGSRADLYGEICQVMLTRRIQAKGLPEIVPGSMKHKLLAMLAYQMMVLHVSDLRADQVMQILEPLMRRMPQSATAQAFLDDVSRNGLLAEPVPGQYAFAHLTFQEYLAARHVKDNPELTQTLIDAIDDQWWRESTLLYAVIASADKIIKSCLDKGTIRTLALAFDCADITDELSPYLREMLAQARERAFAANCNPEYRRLIAGVLAARLSRRAISPTAGDKNCSYVVPADLYWLFVRDRHVRQPGTWHSAQADNPAVGMTGSEALAFVRWLNESIAGSSQVQFRLPDYCELQTQFGADELGQCLPESVTGVWAQSLKVRNSAELWVPAGQSHPHDVTAEALNQAIEADVTDTKILIQVLTAAAWDSVLTMGIALYLGSGTAGGHALGLDLVREMGQAPDPYRPQDLDLDSLLARHLDIAANGARSSHVDVAQDIIRDLDLASARHRALRASCTPDRVLDLALARASHLDHAAERARHLARNPIRADACAIEAYSGISISLLRIPAIPLMWVSRGPMRTAARAAWTGARSATAARQNFAERLTSIAGVSPSTKIRVTSDGLVAASLDQLRLARLTSDRANVATRLADTAIPVLTGSQAVGPLQGAGIRAIALALAADCSQDDIHFVRVFRELAAMVTLLQRRAEGTAAASEALVLALT